MVDNPNYIGLRACRTCPDHEPNHHGEREPANDQEPRQLRYDMFTIVVYGKSIDANFRVRLIGVAESPRLCQHVRILTIGDEILSKRTQVSPASFITGLQKIHLAIAPLGHQHHHNISWDYFQSVTLDDFPESTYPQGLNEIGLSREWALELYAKYGYMVYQHSKLINQNLDIWFLAAAFSKLESLNTVHLSISNKTIRKSSWGSTSDSAYILTSGEHRDRQLHVFLGAAAACSPVLKITNLIIDDDDEGMAVATGRGIGEISNYLIRAALPSLSCIAYLDIPIGEYSESRDNGQDSAVLRIAELLRGLPFLERFSLRNNEQKGIFPVEVASILAAISSNRLQSINLEGCYYRAHRFKAFLMKHGATLQLKNEETEYDNSIEFTRASRDDAIEAISAFVTRKSIHYPSGLVEKDSRFIILGTSSGYHQ
ncbi:hypothetical protein G7Y89_g5633 [Cudoniella acicularis]|uniref:Uncharacterized protein n=1 Tax=Cudoniella acicularis TaxID=354080 RepID=A0A8H4W3L8_9HELO|nr:hypothetical protein G7Y89_g5633 [Cudoniella acicularis]